MAFKTCFGVEHFEDVESAISTFARSTVLDTVEFQLSPSFTLLALLSFRLPQPVKLEMKREQMYLNGQAPLIIPDSNTDP